MILYYALRKMDPSLQLLRVGIRKRCVGGGAVLSRVNQQFLSLKEKIAKVRLCPLETSRNDFITCFCYTMNNVVPLGLPLWNLKTDPSFNK